jgi:hypothetical protein
VDNTDIVTRERLDAFDDAQESVHHPAAQYSVGEFLRSFGAVIAICLGLALIAHVVVTVVGTY